MPEHWFSLRKFLLWHTIRHEKVRDLPDILSEAVVQSCSVEKVLAYNFLKGQTLAQVFSCEFRDIFNNTFFYRKPLMVVFVL